jgi:superfamily II DNA helicase RecQ
MTSDIMYGRSEIYGSGGRESTDDLFFRASLLWHRFLTMTDPEDLLEGRKRSYENFESQWANAKAKRLLRLQQVDLRAQLCTMLKSPDSDFRGRQREVIQAVVRGVTPILYIEATGSGKSLTIMLPAFCSSEGISVVVVPLISLQDDLLLRCRTMMIPATSWSSSSGATVYSSTLQPRVIIITAESACTKGFTEFLRKLSLRAELDRIFIDECHTILDSTADFRPKMKEVGFRLADIGVQMVFLTATLPPSEENTFFSLVRLPKALFTIFRSQTVRTNTRYEVSEVLSVQEEDELAIREAEQFRTTSTTSQKAIIYCSTIDRGTRIAKKLGCPIYFRGAGNTSEKVQIIDDWRTTGGIIVATNALGLGLDIPDVRLVIHAGAPYAMRDYCQESGRAGRDREPCRAIIYFCRRTSNGHRQSDKGAQVSEYLSGLECRRTVIDKVMDGVIRQNGCILTEEVECDVCEKARGKVEEDQRLYEAEVQREMEITQRVSQVRQWMQTTIRQAAMDEISEYERFQQLVRQWASGYCIGCLVQPEGSQKVKHLTIGDCGLNWHTALERAEEIHTEMIVKRRFARFSGCFFCGFPQAMCGRWSARDIRTYVQVGGGECTYGGVFEKALGWLWVIRNPELQYFVRKLHGQMEDKTEFYKWLGKKVRRWGIETNIGCVLLVSIGRFLAQELS